VAQLYSQAPGSIFVAFYDSQGDDGGILTQLHTGRYIDTHAPIIMNSEYQQSNGISVGRILGDFCAGLLAGSH
jgi:hypothetical protein